MRRGGKGRYWDMRKPDQVYGSKRGMKRGGNQQDVDGEDNPNMQPLGRRVAGEDNTPTPAFNVFDRFRDLDDMEREELKQVQQTEKKKIRKTNFERARDTFKKIQDDKQKRREQRNKDKEAREKAIEQYTSTKKKMQKALKKTNKKGQPNLNAQIAVLLEKIQKKVD